MKTKESILDRIKKLKTMQDSAQEIGSTAEAAAFAAKVQKLLLEHKIEMFEVENFSTEDDIQIDREEFDVSGAGLKRSKRVSYWFSALAHDVCFYNGCRSVSMIGDNNITILGTKESRQVVSYILSVLARFGKETCDKEYVKAFHLAKRNNDVKFVRGFNKAFLTAYVHTIRDRLHKAQQAQLEAVGDRGLIVVNAEKQAVQLFLDGMDTVTKETPRTAADDYNAIGARAGEQAGNSVSLTGHGLKDESQNIKNVGVKS